MKVTIKSYHPVAYWKWDTSTEPHKLYHYASPDGDGMDDDDEDEDVCGICQNAYEGTCPECRVPGDDCPLIWGECTHIFHMHCLLKWIDTESSKQQCPMDRRPWVTADRKPDKLPTTTDRAPVATVAPGPLPTEEERRQEDASHEEERRRDMEMERSGEADVGEADSMEVDGN
ncbi:hypothetical protein IAR55_006524 [Kwoniella newhampshirensis]|uniref:Anaphase-promoting complex subunit 11 n=1 Tax=Kwoniella newhampshirensis TaxID=1651941 RepID=A0AAW0YFF1_9TREE